MPVGLLTENVIDDELLPKTSVALPDMAPSLSASVLVNDTVGLVVIGMVDNKNVFLFVYNVLLDTNSSGLSA